MENNANTYYINRISELEKKIKEVRKTISYFYLIRLIIFVFFTVFLVLFIKHSYEYIYLIASFTSFVILLIAVKLDIKFINKEKFISHQLQINKEEILYLDFDFENQQTGEEYSILNPFLVADFDIFGKGSLFQYINRISTFIGKKKLAEGLCKSELNAEKISYKQRAIKELSEKEEFIQIFRTHGKFITENGNEIKNLELWINETIKRLKLFQIISIIFPIITLLWILMIFFDFFTSQSIGIPILTNLLIIYLNIRIINKTHSQLGKTSQIFKIYAELIALIEKEEFTSKYLANLKENLFKNDLRASTSLKSLFSLLNTFDFRYNVVVAFLLNAIFLFDLNLLCKLEKWKKQHKAKLPIWFSTLGEMDELISYATYAFNNKEYLNYPEISEGIFTFSANEMGHPLLHPEIRINNSIRFYGIPSVIIITGANMAGKSTFLRTISVNLILAMNGAPVCANSMTFTPCDIMSSIKIQDSLFNNESYFYAELLRLKDVMHHAISNPKTIIFLDEILRGTNTKDKQTGSLGMIEKLIRQNSIVVIATHDLLIGELEKKYPETVKNYCFEVELTNNQLIFDYKLKNGISNKLNASFLMKKMQIID